LEYKIFYKSTVSKDLKRLDKDEIRRILNGIEYKIVSNPFLGKSLKGDFRGCYRYRFGDYRVIYTISKNEILILRIGHRKEIYR
jgi:mRNA interferase RelE/StbE